MGVYVSHVILCVCALQVVLEVVLLSLHFKMMAHRCLQLRKDDQIYICPLKVWYTVAEFS